MASEPLSPSSGIAEDVECISCGYNLRGLDPAGRCPECGTDISASRRGNLLKYANPEWLGRVKLGADLMYYGIGVAILAGIAGAILTAVIPVFSVVLLTGLGVLSGVFFLAALFLMTTQEPRVSLSEKELTWRRMLRSIAVLHVVASLFNEQWLPQSLHLLVVVASLLQSIAMVFMCYGYFAYAETFAVRVPDEKLARSTRIVKWALPILLLLVAAGPWLILSLGPGGTAGPPPGGGPGTGTPPTIVPILSCAVFLPYLFFVLWALRLLWRYRKALKAAIEEGKALAAAGVLPTQTAS